MIMRSQTGHSVCVLNEARAFANVAGSEFKQPSLILALMFNCLVKLLNRIFTVLNKAVIQSAFIIMICLAWTKNSASIYNYLFSVKNQSAKKLTQKSLTRTKKIRHERRAKMIWKMHQRKTLLDACQSHRGQHVQKNIGTMLRESNAQTDTIMDLCVQFKENRFCLVNFFS